MLIPSNSKEDRKRIAMAKRHQTGAFVLDSFKSWHLYPLMPLFSQGLIHTTTEESYDLIKKSGFIFPNTGQFSFTYPQSEFSVSCGNNWISLFDFESRFEYEIASVFDKWVGFFISSKNKQRLAISIRRENLAPNLIYQEKGKAFDGKAIPIVECWHSCPIPVSAIAFVEPIPCKIIDLSELTVASVVQALSG